MIKYCRVFLVLIVIVCTGLGCGATVNFEQFEEVRPAKDLKTPISIYYLRQEVPSKFIVIGTLKFGDSGFSINCGFDNAVKKAQIKAREVGGDAIQIIKVKSPDFWSSCYRMTFNILGLIKQPNENNQI